MLLGQKLALSANAASSKIAFRHLAKTMNYGEAYKYINRFSYFLQNEIKHNRKVMIYMTNCPHIAYAFFACANTKNLAYLIDPNTPEIKVADIIKEQGIDVVIVSDDMQQRMKDVVKNNRLNLQIIPCETRRWGEYETSYKLPVSMTIKDEEPVAMFETAGTTGKPKWVGYSHTMVQQAALVWKSIYKVSAIDTFMTYNASLMHPFYFMHGLIFPMLSGASIEIADFAATNIEELCKEILESKASRVIMRGSLIEDWLLNFKNMNLKISTVRSITADYSLMKPSTYDFALNEFNIKILNFYGSTETCWGVAGRQFEEPEPASTVGRFLPGVKTRIVDDNGDDIPGNKKQLGQLLVSGQQIATSYYNNKEASKMNMRGQWYFTGDIVEVDKEGIVSFIDRKDNIIFIQNEMIIPKLVEDVLTKIPSIDKASVIATKDQLGKTVVTACLQKKTGMDISSQEVIAHCNELPERHRPTSIVFFPELPLDSRGFVDKYKLRREFK
ncbi:MAG: acyl--CoA ligase [Oligoflexia bacterium]|nr:acyl--CoA ligase [Oligoflexia bacterium]